MAEKTYRNYSYRIEELQLELEKTLENINNVIKKQKYLADTLEKLKDEEFKNLIESLDEDIRKYQTQAEKIEKQLNDVKELFELMKDENNWKFACVLLETLGIFKDEENKENE